jgi:2-polyprenyl-6-methoxyphenol hydroxylase-like FAD-dependent oxidoreductase
MGVNGECDVLVMGSSVSGLMTAAYLKLEHPDLDVVVLGPPPEREKRPYVGESLVEPAILFFARARDGRIPRQRLPAQEWADFLSQAADRRSIGSTVFGARAGAPASPSRASSTGRCSTGRCATEPSSWGCG